ncbi:hypothetical protein [Hyphomicrobium sp. CS1GBMeth3]|uniref:hypothetical protein n=1 Tax=Hyphomicrobium sp. CS1GBMeth3 TaxID=1892845 RepID=UPI000931F28D|nr:hypothetical protein [Hyphomicrobium sp. CS1GBMeth3]
MLDRLKFILGFARTYRNARKDGASPENAKLAAASRMIDARLGLSGKERDGAVLPSEVIALWTDPALAFANADAGDTWFGFGPFEITPQHIELLRKMRLSWDGAERGAPMLDPERPYGRADLIAQLAEAFETDDAQALARRHVEMFYVLGRALKHGSLRPGRYPLRNIRGDDVRQAMRGYGADAGLIDADVGLDADGFATLTDEHLKLLREIQIVWPSQWEAEERLDDGTYPAAAADPKRPYGDFTYIEVDMARILGCLPPPPEGDEPAVFEPEPELAAHLQRLHWQTLSAMQAFVENAELAPGVYDL